MDYCKISDTFVSNLQIANNNNSEDANEDIEEFDDWDD